MSDEVDDAFYRMCRGVEEDIVSFMRRQDARLKTCEKKLKVAVGALDKISQAHHREGSEPCTVCVAENALDKIKEMG